MATTEINTTIVEGYANLLASLSTTNKLDLIARLTASVKTDLFTKQSVFKKAFGAFDSSQTAEDINEDIRNNRLFIRQIESF
jgi:hypothetical protein